VNTIRITAPEGTPRLSLLPRFLHGFAPTLWVITRTRGRGINAFDFLADLEETARHCGSAALERRDAHPVDLDGG